MVASLIRIAAFLALIIARCQAETQKHRFRSHPQTEIEHYDLPEKSSASFKNDLDTIDYLHDTRKIIISVNLNSSVFTHLYALPELWCSATSDPVVKGEFRISHTAKSPMQLRVGLARIDDSCYFKIQSNNPYKSVSNAAPVYMSNYALIYEKLLAPFNLPESVMNHFAIITCACILGWSIFVPYVKHLLDMYPLSA